MAGATDAATAASAPADPPVEAPVAAPAFDLSKKKKKKKPKAHADEGATTSDQPVNDMPADAVAALSLADPADPNALPLPEEQPVDFSLPDFSGKKKKKKKKVVFDDDGENGDGDQGLTERASRREVVPQPWDDSDRDYTYEELINRAFQFLHGKNPALASGGSGRKKVSLPLPQVAREGTKKTVFLNFGAICKIIHRQQDHLLAYMSAELGTTGNIQDGGRLVIKGRFGAEGIANVLKRYMLEYVICISCRSPDTVLMRDANTRLYFVSCETCGAKRSVAPIRQGFMAQVERRKKKG